MTCRNIFLTCLLAAQLASTSAFSARSLQSPSLLLSKQQQLSSPIQLQASSSSISEQEASYMMAKAQECAFSDTCSIEESSQHLIDVLNLQVACASGTVHDVCNDQQEVAEIVAKLRDHVQNGSHGLTPRQTAFQGALPVVFLALTCASMLLASATSNPNVVPFTPQEIMWAARDGYLDDLVHHFLQNGGLLISDVDVVPLQAKEIFWAVRDGYADDLLSHYLRNGGL